MSTPVPTTVARDASDLVAPRIQSARFAEALRPGVMGPRLAAAFGGDPRDCHVLDAKFEPDRSATVLYALGDRLLRGDLVLSRHGTVPDQPAALIAFPGVVVWPFPHDPDLPSLAPLMSAGRHRAALLRYRPGKRATVLVRPGPTVSRVAKVYHDPAKAAAVASEAEALAPLTASCGTLRLAPLVAHLPHAATVIHLLLPGTQLAELVAADPRGVATSRAVARAAAALAELHRLPPVSGRQRQVETELARFRLRAARVGTVDPTLGAELAGLAARLGRVAAGLPAPGTGLVHGDCKPSQFLVDGDRVVLLDLDHCGISDPAVDPGTFLATLRQHEVRQQMAGSRRGRGALASVAESFLAAYLAAAPAAQPARVQWHEAVALERKALRCFARAPRSPLAGALVEEAHRCLDDLGLDPLPHRVRRFG